jgi:hypothetical protein
MMEVRTPKMWSRTYSWISWGRSENDRADFCVVEAGKNSSTINGAFSRCALVFGGRGSVMIGISCCGNGVLLGLAGGSIPGILSWSIAASGN